MKKILALILTLTLCASMTAALAQTADGMQLGLYVDTTVSGSMDASDEDGAAVVESVAVAVLMDAEGKIVDIDIDDAQTNMPFTAAGELGADFPAESMTKRELGANYGMSMVSKIGDWDAQIAALAAYLIGKTADEVGGVALDDSAHATDAELVAGCTMSIGGYIGAVVEAMKAAQPVEAAATDKVGLGIVTTTSKSKPVADGKDGMCEAYSYFAAVTANESGAITACVLDSTQGRVSFDAKGVITSDVTARTLTKRELGDDYGMRAASGLGKEWYEQAEGFSAYVMGKTADEVQGIAMDEKGKATDAELTATTTVGIGHFVDVVVKALGYAK